MVGKKVLIVEDEPTAITVYLQFFAILETDIIPVAARSYKDAKEILSKESIDLMILDVMLPDVLATDILGELVAEYPEVPIFLVTGHPEYVDHDRVNQFGVAHLFLKPVHMETFCRAVQESLDDVDWCRRPSGDSLH